jgi:hypothetical protein
MGLSKDGWWQALFKECDVSGLEDGLLSQIPNSVPTSTILIPNEVTHPSSIVQLLQLHQQLDDSTWGTECTKVSDVCLLPVEQFKQCTVTMCPLQYYNGLQR